MRSAGHTTFPCPGKHATGMFSTLATLEPAFQVRGLISEKSDSRSCRTFLYPLHPLDIAPTDTAATHYGSLSTVVTTAARDPGTFPRAKKRPPDTYCTSLRTGAALSSPVSLSKKSVDRSRRTFLAGALGLEPRAYGFGDEADKSASGGLPFEVNFSTIQKQIAAAFAKPIKNETNREFQQQAYGLLGLRSISPKPSAQKLYHIPLILARIRGLFLASFGSNRSQSL